MSAGGGVGRVWADLNEQWAANPRLRVGLMIVVGILWTYGLLLCSDHVAVVRAQTRQLQDDAARTQPLAREQGWPRRSEDARQQLEALRAMRWTDAEVGLVEARLQDWLRSVAAKTGLGVRELKLQHGAQPPAAGASTTGEFVIRARVVTELNRLPLLAFLAELGRSEQVIVVERLVMRPAAQPALAEIEMKVLAATRGAGAGSTSGTQP